MVYSKVDFLINDRGRRSEATPSITTLLLVALVLFTPVRVAFGLVVLPAKLYLIALGLILVPLVVMELSKAIGLIKHPSKK